MKLLGENTVYSNSYTDDEGNRNKLFEIKKKFDKIQDKPGLSIDVYMEWISEEGKYIEEYLVTPKLLIDTMKKAGCN